MTHHWTPGPEPASGGMNASGSPACFGITAKEGLLAGSTSPLATEVVLTVDTGIAGEFVLQQSAR